MEELVSVIVPIYNTSAYLDNCISSILKQDYSNLEIILVNDGSTDDSLSICKKYASNDSRISIIDSQNYGVSHARNLGLQGSRGKYICFVDSDDYVMHDYVSYLTDLIKKNKVDIAATTEMYTSFKNISDNQCKNSVKILSGHDATYALLTYKFPIGVYCKIFDRDFLIKNKVAFDEELVIGEGFNFNIDSFQFANKVAIGNKKIYFYRRNNYSSTTTSFSAKKWENGIYAIEKIRKKIIFNNKQIRRALDFAEWHTNRDVVDLMLLCKKKQENKKLYDSCRSICRKYWRSPYLVKTSLKEKIRAILVLFFPNFIPFIMRRRLKNASKVK